MNKVSTIKGLIDFAYNKYKTKNSVSIEKGYTKNINYFNYRFDIYSLARAIDSKIKDKNIAIISENRYEFLVTYLANIILKNKIIIIDSNLSQNAIIKIIKKYNINTVFFSEKNKEKILEIYRTTIKKKKLNLINFDSNNKFPIIEYEKLINIGRYIENYSIDNIPDTDEKIKDIIIANLVGTKEYSQQDFITSAYIIGKNMRIRRKRKIQINDTINSFYQIVVKIIVPMLYGLNIQFIDTNCLNTKYNIDIVHEEKNRITVKYRSNKYLIENINVYTYVMKIEDELISKKPKREEPNFVLIKSDKREKIKENKKRATIYS